MLSDEIRRKLRKLGEAKARPESESESESEATADCPGDGGLARLRQKMLKGAAKATAAGGGRGEASSARVATVRRIALPAQTEGPLVGEEVANEAGACLAIRLALGEVADWGDEFWQLLLEFAARDAAGLHHARPEELAFFDIETTGLSAQPLFLIGILRADEGGPHIVQYLARDYAEEAAALRAGLEALGAARTLVSFNGRSFDLPYIKDRAAYHRLRIDLPKQPHVDLLVHARRRWRGRFADNKLQTLETGALGITRTSDIPGHQIPEAYHEFVRSGCARQMHEILHHNRLDLLTLAALVGELLGDAEPKPAVPPA